MEEERLIILRLIQEGKITAEEGAALLKALESPDAGVADDPTEPNGESDPAAQREDSGSFGEDWGERITESFRKAKERTESRLRRLRSRAQEQTAGDMERVLDHVNRAFASAMAELPDLINRVPQLVSNIYAKGPGHTFKESFRGEFASAGAPIDIVVKGHNGSITLIGCDEPGYRVEVEGRIRADDQLEAKRLAVGMLNRHETPTALHLNAQDAGSGKVNLTLFLQSSLEYRVQLVTHNGPIKVDGIRATNVDLTTTNGSVGISNSTAQRVSVDVTNGGFHCDELVAEEVTAKSINGTIRLAGSVPHARLNTVNGSVHVAPDIHADAVFELRTVNGRINFTAPAPDTAAYRLDLKTHMGHVNVDLPDLVLGEHQQQGMKASLQAESASFAERSPKVTITARSERGSIQVVRTSESGAKEDREEPDAPNDSDQSEVR